MLQFKYMMFINFTRTLCRVEAVIKKEEGYIFYTCFFYLLAHFWYTRRIITPAWGGRRSLLTWQ